MESLLLELRAEGVLYYREVKADVVVFYRKCGDGWQYTTATYVDGLWLWEKLWLSADLPIEALHIGLHPLWKR